MQEAPNAKVGFFRGSLSFLNPANRIPLKRIVGALRERAMLLNGDSILRPNSRSPMRWIRIQVTHTHTHSHNISNPASQLESFLSLALSFCPNRKCIQLPANKGRSAVPNSANLIDRKKLILLFRAVSSFRDIKRTIGL